MLDQEWRVCKEHQEKDEEAEGKLGKWASEKSKEKIPISNQWCLRLLRSKRMWEQK